MNNQFGILCFISLFSIQCFSQSQTIENVLSDIEKNNGTLKAYLKQMESEQIDNNSSNNLQNPELSMYYLPWGQNTEGNYHEIQLSQRFDFPTVYSQRKKVNKFKALENNSVYAIKRQEILLEAKKICIDLIYYDKQIRIEQSRLSSASKLYNQNKIRFNEQEVSIIDLNKSKLGWLQTQFKVKDLKVKRQNLLLKIEQLNKGIALIIKPTNTDQSFNLPPLKTLWDHFLNNAPEIHFLQNNISSTQMDIGLQKAKGLPKITLGVNKQSIPNTTHLGLYTGFTLPLWENKNKVKSVQVLLKSKEEYLDNKIEIMYSQLEQSYLIYQNKLAYYHEYKETLQTMKNESLLLESYQLGEMSFLRYYSEIQFHRMVEDQLLELENQLYKLKAELLKVQL